MNLLIRSAWQYLKIITIGLTGKRKAIKYLEKLEKRYNIRKHLHITPLTLQK